MIGKVEFAYNSIKIKKERTMYLLNAEISMKSSKKPRIETNMAVATIGLKFENSTKSKLSNITAATIITAAYTTPPPVKTTPLCTALSFEFFLRLYTC